MQRKNRGLRATAAPTTRSTRRSRTRRLMESRDILVGPPAGRGTASPTTPVLSRTRRSSTASPVRRTCRTPKAARGTSSASTRTARSGPPASATTRTTTSAGRRPRSSVTTTRSRTRRSPASWPGYCAVGDVIRARLGAAGREDYSSYISQIPEDIDGMYVGIGGSGLVSFIGSTSSSAASRHRAR